MSEIPLRTVGPLKKRRVMNEQEIRERHQLNQENTATRLRARVLSESNGYRGGAAR